MSKVINKLVKKHRNPIKAKKQKLIDKINSCKTKSELRGYEKTLSYYSVLKNDEDWDYGYFFDLIRFKLKKMSNYFHTHNIVKDEDWYGTLCDRAINILDAGYNTIIITKDDLGDIYVNTKNVHRFIGPKQLDFILNHKLEKYYLPAVREEKAKFLFWKFMHHYIEYLWD